MTSITEGSEGKENLRQTKKFMNRFDVTNPLYGGIRYLAYIHKNCPGALFKDILLDKMKYSLEAFNHRLFPQDCLVRWLVGWLVGWLVS